MHEVTLFFEELDDGTLAAWSLGLRKFGRPDLVLLACTPDGRDRGRAAAARPRDHARTRRAPRARRHHHCARRPPARGRALRSRDRTRRVDRRRRPGPAALDAESSSCVILPRMGEALVPAHKGFHGKVLFVDLSDADPPGRDDRRGGLPQLPRRLRPRGVADVEALPRRHRRARARGVLRDLRPACSPACTRRSRAASRSSASRR